MRRPLALIAGFIALGLLVAGPVARGAEPGSIGAPAAEDAQPRLIGGVETAMPRIVGGEEVDPGSYPWAVALESGPYFCGGSLIGDQWVLTAAHCTRGVGAGEMTVVVGRHDYSGSGGEEIGVAVKYEHPQYGYPMVDSNDVAVLRLLDAATLGAPIRWAAPGDDWAFQPETMATVIGWGTTQNDPPGARPFRGLREVDVPVVTDAACADAYPDDFDGSTMICAGFPEGGADSCQGDSGGSLFVPFGAGYLHIGIVSFGEGCAEPGFPGVYTETSAVADWIADVTGISQPPTCMGYEVTIMGGGASEVIEGTPGDDVIDAGRGDDVVNGRGGNDVICAGPGSDVVDGGVGDDLLFGNSGNDTLDGDAGDDVIYGGQGADDLLGGAGNDLVDGESGPDTLDGGIGDDVLFGSAWHDTLIDDGGADQLWGGSGNDDLRSGADNDRLEGQGGNDVLDGGIGIDTLIGGGLVDVCSNGERWRGCEGIRRQMVPAVTLL